MFQTVARRAAGALAGALVATALVGSAHATVYDTVGDVLAVGDGYFNKTAAPATFSLAPLLALDLGLSSQLPLEISLGVTLSTDRSGGSVSPAASLSGLARIDVSNDLVPDTTGNWTTVLSLGTTVSHTGSGTVTQLFPPTLPAVAQPGSAYRYVRVVFEGVLTDKDAVGFSANVQAVPEPGTWAMFLAGVFGIAFIAKKRLA